jgi:AraC-like DNA-binding protein
MILTVPDDHHYWVEKGKHWEFFYLSLIGQEMMRACQVALLRRGPVWEISEDSVLWQKALAVYALAAEGGGDSAFRVSEACYALAMTLLSESTAADKALLPRPPGVQLAMKFAREKLDQRIGVSEMAAVSGMSLFHFSRVFRDSVGLSPGAFLMEERIRRATTLLHSTTLPIGEVARRCGYTDLNYFVRVFRQSTGMPPGRFRRSGF